ncbi:MAG TPA: DNA polymerase [bacterium]|nr:DNA polymerase [bacterium]
MTRILVLDVSAYLFRAYHALPPMNAPDGSPVNAIYGCAAMFLRVAKRFGEFRAVAALDCGRDTVRRERYPEYKANRKELDDELRVQFAYMPEMLGALGLTAMAVPGYEADDVIAAVRLRHPDDEVIIISSDKDLMQLVDDHTFLYDGVKDRLIDAAAVQEKFEVPPVQLRDLLAMSGDSSDNIPGLPGVGPKTAAKLLAQYADINDIYAHLDALQPKLRDKFTNFRDQLMLSRDLVTLITDIELPPLPDEPWRGPDPDKFRAFIDRFGFRSLQRHLDMLAALPDRPITVPSVSQAPVVVEPLESVVPEREELLFSFDGRLYAAFEGAVRAVTAADITPDRLWCGFDMKEYLPPSVDDECRFVDLQLAYFILDSGRHQYGMSDVAGYLDIAPAENSGPEAIAAQLTQMREKILPQITGDPRRRKLLYDIEMPNLTVVRDMERYGIAVDLERLAAMRTEYTAKLAQIESSAHDWAGGPVNLNSPKQLAQVLFEKLGLPVRRKSKSGPSTDVDVLEELAPYHPLPGLILEHRQFQKLLSTYIEPIAQKVDTDGRLRSSFILTHAATGRLSSRDPNLQNIPVRTEEGRRIRSLFPVAPGCRFISLDYDQVELRVLAALSDDTELKSAFKNGEDIHRKTASAIFGVFPEFVDDTMRRHAKAVNFGIVYGMQAFKLSQDTGVEMKFAKEYIDQYFRFYTGVKRFIDATIDRARGDGWVETMHGRRRAVPELNDANKNIVKSGERMAVNTVIQGTAAEIMKLGAVRVRAAFAEALIPARILLAIHDELILEVPAGRADECGRIAAEAMQSVLPDFPVPLTVSVSQGSRWDELD